MADIVLTGNTSGAITVAAPAVAGTNTLTLPATTGNIVTTGDSSTITQGMIGSNVAGTGPAFRAYLSSDQSISNNVWTKVQMNVEDFDTNSNYDNVTNYRFTPTVAGYYQVNFRTRFNGTSMTGQLCSLWKNGSINSFANTGRFATSSDIGLNGADIVYMNGTTDYLEVYGYLTASSGHIFQAASYNTFFSATLARAA